jgi:hypothetical protein
VGRRLIVARILTGDRWERRLLTVAYLMFGVTGTIVVMVGVSGMVADALGWITFGWGGFMAFGGYVSAAGQMWNRWIGELVGIPAMITACGFMGFVLGILAIVGGRFTTGAAITPLLFALSILLGILWRRVWREADDDADRQSGRHAGEGGR